MSARRRLRALLLAGITFATPLAARAQNRGGPPPTAKASAPVDLTGYWVSVVNEDWRYRMVTPAKGDYKGVPITSAATRRSPKPVRRCSRLPARSASRATFSAVSRRFSPPRRCWRE